MSYQVVNGSIPHRVERYLTDTNGCGMAVVHTQRPGVWGLYVFSDLTEFAWTAERDPTLQDAIEAVVGEWDRD